MADRESLKQAIADAEKVLATANFALATFDALPENNVFPTLEEAADCLEELLREEAAGDCEGSYNCGQPSYAREFIVGGLRYVGTLSVEYNRHDKQYYYIDLATFAYALKGVA